MKVRVNYVWIIATVVILGGFLAWNYLKPNDNTYDNFAKCLSNKGIVMYGAKTCGHCSSQKKMFGDSFKYINYIECTDQLNLCQQNGITGVPAWIIDGVKYSGEQPLEKLSELSGCEL
jgi:glutaredoxin